MCSFLVRSILRQCHSYTAKELSAIKFDSNTIKHSRSECLPSKKNALKLLQNLSDLPTTTVLSIIKTNPEFSAILPCRIDDNYNICRRYYPNNFILKNLDMLTYSNLSQKFGLLTKLSVDLKNYVHFLNIRMNEFNRVLKIMIANQNMHIETFKEITQLNEDIIVSKLSSHVFIFGMSIKRLREVLELYKEFGVSPNSIISDIWCLRYNPQLIRNRLQKVIDLNVQKPMTWMARCSVKVFENYTNRMEEFNSSLGCNDSVDEFLANKLNCTVNCAKQFRKLSRVSGLSLKKINDKIDLLLENGFTAAQILCVPRILQYSLEKISSRINELFSLNHKPSSLLVLCSSKNEFDLLVNRLKDSRKRKLGHDS